MKNIFHIIFFRKEPGSSAVLPRKRMYLLLALIISVSFSACKKFTDVGVPQTSLTTSTVFSSDPTATSAMLSVYEQMAQYYSSAISGEASFTDLGGLSSDELDNYDSYSDLPEFPVNQLHSTNSTVRQDWTQLYGLIYTVNSVIEGTGQSQSLSASVKQQLQGEAKFMRAFFYFYLVNFWGDVPLVTSTDYTKNSRIARSTSSAVYDQIISDLKDAQTMLGSNYTGSEKIRPNKFTATALLARVYLYKGDWTNAEAQASQVISSGLYSLVPDLNNVFLKNSTEAIWQLQSIVPYINTWDGYTFVLTSDPYTVSLKTQLVNSFEPGDNRFVNWIHSYTDGSSTWYYPFKYKVRTLPSATATKTEYLMIFRLAEQYLIRSEARAKQNNISGSQSDLNTIRNRAGLGNTPASTQAQLLSAIEQERKVELFTEWGHRWMDLKRTNRADAVLATLKAPNWQSTDLLYPIPQDEISRNPLLTQNPGY